MDALKLDENLSFPKTRIPKEINEFSVPSLFTETNKEDYSAQAIDFKLPILPELSNSPASKSKNDSYFFIFLALSVHVFLIYLLMTTTIKLEPIQRPTIIKASLFYPTHIKPKKKNNIVESIEAPQSERQVTQKHVPMPPIRQSKVKYSNKSLPPAKLKDKLTTSLSSKSLSSLVDKVKKQSLDKSLADWTHDRLAKESSIAKSHGKFQIKGDISELKLKRKTVDCANTLSKSAAILSGLLGGRIKCERPPSLTKFLENKQK
ncbi:hypothetical protein Q4489_10910 [Thalassotalea sp. 1_MG-2023]|uniref:hypothetical protein n=1 Tax=Thalassotalea sp. 1_MG-2023 TaxID=3062680 RepID=UPI0026E3067F|nr:hypothetical protein [Thalassotalea sp. 1_MG-2023]MDO6427528.1 hypothetical protein [Thalassotalea sp. 1_MG-2023]